MTIREFLVRRRATIGVALAVLFAAGVLQFAGVNPAASQNLALTAFAAGDDPGINPDADAWSHVPWVQVPLTAQAGSYAAGGGSIPVVTAKALHYQDKVYLRVEWQDATKDESTAKVESFADAVAVEFPARSAATVPSLCMGQADAGVNIWQWRADSQAGIKDPVDIYAGAAIDGYPSKEMLFYTARAAGNPYADPALGPVQTLVSHTFGTLSKANVQDVQGKGVYKDGKWAVVFERQFSGGDVDQASFNGGTVTDMAFAIWNGSEGDRNGRKSVSQFVKLSLSTTQSAQASDKAWIWLVALGSVAAAVGLGVALGVYGYREGRRS
jgi:complex iron-sulfur molybdoenzyme family reductase subunit gamma